jgi:hypothetical protein
MYSSIYVVFHEYMLRSSAGVRKPEAGEESEQREREEEEAR